MSEQLFNALISTGMAFVILTIIFLCMAGGSWGGGKASFATKTFAAIGSISAGLALFTFLSLAWIPVFLNGQQ